MTEPLRWTYETEPCGRCGGTGSYSYCQMYGTKCFDCQGRKVRLTKRARAIRAQVTAIRERRRLTGDQLQPGHIVRQLPGQGRPWLEVTRVEATTEWAGSSTTNGVTETFYYNRVTFADGTTSLEGRVLWERKATPAELAEIEAILQANAGKGVTSEPVAA